MTWLRRGVTTVAGAWPHVLSVLIQISVPALLAFTYSFYDWNSSGKHFNGSAFAKVFFPALFFIMWFVGMFERAKKRSSDKESFDGIKSDIKSLTSLVRQLKTISQAASPAPSPGSAPSVSRSLMEDSWRIFGAGHSLAALLQAGVAFERALRGFAQRKGVAEAESMPMLHLLRKIDWLMPQGWKDEMHMLRKIRNQMAHATERELSDLGDVEFLLRNYASAVNVLDPANDVEQ